MAGYNNPRYTDIENEVLRSRLANCKAGAQALADAVHRYLRQECLLSELEDTPKEICEQLKKLI